ncbi:palmitoyl-acyl carrier protein thioesterase, chloroplastic-like protein, partial [Tanacetum coccineum]
SVPLKVLEKYNMGSITLEYRRECRQSDMLDSLTSMRKRLHEEHNKSTAPDASHNTSGTTDMECTHLLRMQDGKADIVRARTVWILKH